MSWYPSISWQHISSHSELAGSLGQESKGGSARGEVSIVSEGHNLRSFRPQGNAETSRTCGMFTRSFWLSNPGENHVKHHIWKKSFSGYFSVFMGLCPYISCFIIHERIWGTPLCFFLKLRTLRSEIMCSLVFEIISKISVGSSSLLYQICCIRFVSQEKEGFEKNAKIMNYA